MLPDGTMLLVPTEREAQGIRDSFASDPPTTHVCGFGPISAAAETARLIAQENPAAVVLAGIAGTYELEACPIGSARRFQAVGCWGIGAGEGAAAIGPVQMGFPQWQAGSKSIFDRIDLQSLPQESVPNGLLLTCCRAAATHADVQQRRRAFPDAIAEDMEGFAVAMACRIQDVPLTIVRGISNVAGDRNVDNWSIAAALNAVGNELRKQFA